MTSISNLSKQYLVAFNNGPFDDPANITTVAAPGVLGAVNVWTDITQFVDSHRISRGRQHELQQFEAGTCALHLNNQDARFNPWNTSSPYTGKLLPRKLMQVRVTWNGTTYTRFTGHVDAWPVDWPDPISGWAYLHATDAFRLFNLNNVTSTGYATQVLADGATNYWRLGDPIGSTAAYDSAIAGYDGHYQGTYTLGSPGAMPADPTTSVDFTTGTGDVSVPTLAGPLSNSSVVSIEGWVNLTALPSPGQVSVIYQNDSTQTIGHLGLWVDNSGAIEMAMVDDSNNVRDGLSGGTIAANSGWHHVVGVFNAGTISLYIDGVSQTITPINGTPVNWTPGTAAIGQKSLVPGGVGSGTNLQGSVQDVAVYTTALSAATVLNHFNLGALPAVTADTRITRILNIVGWSATARNIDTNTSGSAGGFGGFVPLGGVQAVTSPLTSTSSLSHMQDVENSEGGALYMTTTGQVRFVSRQTLFSSSTFTTSQQTIGDAGSDLPMDPAPTIGLDDIDLYNEAVATRSGGNTQRSTVSSSITTYGRVTWQPPAQLLNNSDIEVLGLVQYITLRFATPVVRVQAVTVNLYNLLQSNQVGNLLALDLLYAITVERQGVPGGGTAFSQLCNVERIDETSTPDSYTITIGTAVVNPVFWVLGTSALGQTTALAY